MLYNALLNNATSGTPEAERVAGNPIPLQPASHEARSTSILDQPRTVLVADPVGVIAQALGPVLVQYIGCRVVHARTVAQVHEVIDDGVKGELAVVSLSLSHQAPAVIQALRGSGWPRVLALTTSGLPLASAIDAGIDGVVRVPWVEPGPLHPVARLSPREYEIIGLVADGLSNKAIGNALALSPLTVKNHLARIGRKLDARDRAHIVAIAYRGGALHRPDVPVLASFDGSHK